MDGNLLLGKYAFDERSSGGCGVGGTGGSVCHVRSGFGWDDGCEGARSIVRGRSASPWGACDPIRAVGGGAALVHERARDVVLGIDDCEETRRIWDHPFHVELSVRFGAELGIRMAVRNTGSEAFDCEMAFHPYFVVGDIRKVGVRGLRGATYISKTEGMARKVDVAEEVRFEGETDRVYLGATGECVMEEPGRRTVFFEKSGSRSTVVWNPWVAKAAAMADFGDEEWPRMICVEQANAADDALQIGAGQVFEMSAVYRVEASPR